MRTRRTTVLALAAACTTLPAAALIAEGTAQADGSTTPTAPPETATTATTTASSPTTTITHAGPTTTAKAPAPPTTTAVPAPQTTLTLPATATPTSTVPAPPAATARTADASAPYYGNPKMGVEVSPNEPGQYPLFPVVSGGPATTPALGFFDLQGAQPDTGAVNGSCTTAGLDAFGSTPGNGGCDMGTGGLTFPVTDPDGDPFTFSVASTPPGWVVDPNQTFPLPATQELARSDVTAGASVTPAASSQPPTSTTTTIYPCGGQGQNDCSDENGTFVPIFDAIGTWRTLETTVTSQVTGAPLAGVTVHLSCTPPAGVPTGEPAGYACPTDVPDVKTDSNGQATFSGVFVPGASVEVTTTSGLPSPYQGASYTATVPSPVTASTTTGPEIAAATTVPVTLPLTPTGPLPDYAGTTPENTPYTVKGIGQNTAYGNLTPTSVSQPSHGTAKLNADGTVTYTPSAGYVGTDTFTYTAVGSSTSTSTSTTSTTSTVPGTSDARRAATATAAATGTGGTGTVTMTVTPLAAPTTAASSPPAASSTAAATAPAAPTGALAFTGADIAGTVAAGGVLIGTGAILTRVSRRRRRRAGGQPR